MERTSSALVPTPEPPGAIRSTFEPKLEKPLRMPRLSTAPTQTIPSTGGFSHLGRLLFPAAMTTTMPASTARWRTASYAGSFKSVDWSGMKSPRLRLITWAPSSIA